MKKEVIISSVVLVALAAGSAANAQAVTRQLNYIDGSNVVNTGWSYTTDTGVAVGLVVDAYTAGNSGVLVLQKIATFTKVDPITGIEPIRITFTRTDSSAPLNLYITDETVTNQTGKLWTSFNMQLQPDTGLVAFDPAASAGFSTFPFTTTSFLNGNTIVSFSGGPGVPNGGLWNPGTASGALAIKVNPIDNLPVIFTLKEIPVPTPGSAALMGLGGLVVARRRR